LGDGSTPEDEGAGMLVDTGLGIAARLSEYSGGKSKGLYIASSKSVWMMTRWDEEYVPFLTRRGILTDNEP